MIYNINEELLAKGILPPNKRTDIQIAWLKNLLTGMQRSNILLNDYIDGFFGLSFYNISTTYNIGDRIISGYDYNCNIYESQTDSNTGNPLIDTTNWLNISTNFIGSKERVAFKCNKIVFEWALNRYFITVFRQPTTIGTGIYGPLSDIFISDVVPVYTSFVSYSTETLSSTTFIDRSSDYIFTTEIYGISETFAFNINIPIAVYSALPGYTGAGSVDNLIRNFADKYSCFGTQYQIITY